MYLLCYISIINILMPPTVFPYLCYCNSRLTERPAYILSSYPLNNSHRRQRDLLNMHMWSWIPLLKTILWFSIVLRIRDIPYYGLQAKL